MHKMQSISFQKFEQFLPLHVINGDVNFASFMAKKKKKKKKNLWGPKKKKSVPV